MLDEQKPSENILDCIMEHNLHYIIDMISTFDLKVDTDYFPKVYWKYKTPYVLNTCFLTVVDIDGPSTDRYPRNFTTRTTDCLVQRHKIANIKGHMRRMSHFTADRCKASSLSKAGKSLT